MVSTADPSILKRQRTLLQISTDALCLAVSTALRLADKPLTVQAKSSSNDVPEGLREISLDQVSWHDTSNDCWIVVCDKVYDVTSFLIEHPGGEEIILEYAGRDATLAFRAVGHSTHALHALEKYLIGQLPPHERIFQSGGKLASYSSNPPLSANS